MRDFFRDFFSREIFSSKAFFAETRFLGEGKKQQKREQSCPCNSSAKIKKE